MSKYLACGNIMMDTVVFADGQTTGLHMGGPALFAGQGMKLYSDDVAIVGNVGCDFVEQYQSFFDKNNYPTNKLNILNENGLISKLTYFPSGLYKWEVDGGETKLDRFEFKYTNLQDKIDIETKGIYLFMYPKDDFFNHIDDLKRGRDCKIMWEYGSFRTTKLEDSFEELKYVNMLSLNSFDASCALKVDRRDENTILQKLSELPIEMIFYRVGARGSYVITNKKAVFCPSVLSINKEIDSSGCGNSSSGACMLNWLETGDPIISAIRANIAAGFNIAQYGPYPYYEKKDKEIAQQVENELLKNVSVRNL